MKEYNLPLGGRTGWLLILILLSQGTPVESQTLCGELRQWHALTLNFNGPETSESDLVNPFLDYRLDVTFCQGTREIVVPGYYAGDGKAAYTGASAGNRWQVRFAPDTTGEWSFAASFRKGSDIAASTDPEAGSAVAFDGVSGKFTVHTSDKKAPDFRGRGWLRYVGKPYPRFGNGEYFIRSGPGGPENFLGYSGFDNTPDEGYRHDYVAHVQDHDAVDDYKLWRGEGKGILGLVNYISELGMNSMYLISNTAGGDTKDTFPWTGPRDYMRYDVSKLAQWEIVFSHMTEKGIELHFFFNEEENDLHLDGGELGIARKVYYREMVARFGHHLGVTWNIGEEINTTGGGRPTDEQIKDYCRFIRAVDPYDHPIAVHNADSLTALFTPLLGFPDVEMATIQTTSNHAPNGLDPLHQQIVDWRRRSADAGRPWIVTNDEQGGWRTGLPQDKDDPWHPVYRRKALWGALMAGGGIAYYWNPDVSTEELRSREQMWRLSTLAVDFFQTWLPFWEMENSNELTVDTRDYVFAKQGEIYAIYLPHGGSAKLDLGGAFGAFKLKWFNPRDVDNRSLELLTGSVAEVEGGKLVSTGQPPHDPQEDWVVLVSTPEWLSRMQ